MQEVNEIKKSLSRRFVAKLRKWCLLNGGRYKDLSYNLVHSESIFLQLWWRDDLLFRSATKSAAMSSHSKDSTNS